jgi:HSP20 family protein
MLNLWNALDDVMRADPWFRPFLMGPERETAPAYWPSVDVAEVDNAYLIAAELPGVKPEDVTLEIENNVLTLSAQKRPDPADERHEYRRMERSYGAFQRSFVLPEGVQTDHVQATMKDGVLTLHIPKPEHARARKVPIQIGVAKEAPAQLTAGASESQQPAAPAE